MIRILFGVFIVLHGLVHLLYFGQSSRLFELQAGMAWPDGTWAFSKFLNNDTIRILTNVFLILAAVSFIAGGVAVLAKQDWWRMIVISAAIFSTIIYLLLWNGSFENLANNGWVGILINLLILFVMLIFKWPKF